MKSLFLRVFMSLWLTMALVLGLFAVVHAVTFPAEFSSRYRKNTARFTELRATLALDCMRTHATGCQDPLDPIDDRDATLAVFQEGVRVLGPEVTGVEEVEVLARQTGATSAKSEEARELLAVVLDRPEGRFVAVSVQRKPSIWVFFLGPDTLLPRLIGIVLVTGLLSVLLARYLSRPIRTLRAATRELGEGDLSVRVSPKLGSADSETLALGHEMDRMAERIEALLDGQKRLLRDVSHELRSPLARLNIALELVRRRSPPEAKEALDRIEREALRLEEMIAELLTLSRLEAGATIERSSVDLSALVESVGEDVRFEAEEAGKKLELAAERGVTLQGNEELLRRTIENIMRNAVRFTEPGTAVDVTLTLRGQAATLEVRDHGPGVPEPALEAIFEPFFRVEEHRAKRGGGAGIGLAIAKRAAAAHSGSLRAENASGGGLRVELCLPAASG